MGAREEKATTGDALRCRQRRSAETHAQLQATVRHTSGLRSMSVAVMELEQKGHGRCRVSSARVHAAHVMLWPQGYSVTVAGASMQTTQPSSPFIASGTSPLLPRAGNRDDEVANVAMGGAAVATAPRPARSQSST